MFDQRPASNFCGRRHSKPAQRYGSEATSIFRYSNGWCRQLDSNVRRPVPQRSNTHSVARHVSISVRLAAKFLRYISRSAGTCIGRGRRRPDSCHVLCSGSADCWTSKSAVADRQSSASVSTSSRPPALVLVNIQVSGRATPSLFPTRRPAQTWQRVSSGAPVIHFCPTYKGCLY